MKKFNQYMPLLIPLALLICYSQVFFQRPITIDDDFHIFENPYLVNMGAGWAGLWNSLKIFFSTPMFGLYMPLTLSVWAVLAKLTQWIFQEPFNVSASFVLFKSTNLLFHCLNSYLVYLILMRVMRVMNVKEMNIKNKNNFGQSWPALVGALLFALHPLQVEPVVWLSGLKDMLSSFFFLLAILTYLNDNEMTSEKARTDIYPLRVTFYFFLALLSKPTTIVLPLYLALYDFFFLKIPLKKIWNRVFPLLFMVLFFVVLTQKVQEEYIVQKSYSLMASPLIALDALSFYIFKLIYPYPLLVEYSRNPTYLIQEGIVAFSWIIPLTVLVTMFRVRQKYPFFLLGAVIFILWVLPVLGFMPFAYQYHSTVADRYVYLGMMGIGLMLTGFFQYLYPLVKRPMLKRAFFAPLIIFPILTINQVQHWKDSLTLYDHVMKNNDKSALIHVNYGLEELRRGNMQAAFEHNLKAQELKPDYERSLENLISFAALANDLKKAEQYASELLKINPKSGKAYIFMGDIAAQQGHYSEASHYLTKALEFYPSKAEVYFLWGKILSQQGNAKEALSMFQTGFTFQEGGAEVYLNLGNSLSQLGDIEKAKAAFEKALSIKSNFPAAYFNLGNLYYRQQKYDRAIYYYQKSLEIDPNFQLAKNNLQVVTQQFEKQHNL